MAFVEFRNLAWSIKQISKMVDNGTIDFDYPIQRKSGMWNTEGQSLLVYSMVAHIPIPPIYFISHKASLEEVEEFKLALEEKIGQASEDEAEREKLRKAIKLLKEGDTIRQILDGKQRLSNLYSFMKDEFTLHENTPSVTLQEDNETYELAGKKFSELDEAVRDVFLTRNLLTYTVDGDNVDSEQIEFIFLLMNNGVALKSDQKLKSIIGFEMADKISEYDNNEFIHKCAFSPNNLKVDAHISAILQYLMLRELFDSETDYQPKKFAINDIMDYANVLRKRPLEQRQQTFQLVDEVFEYGRKVLANNTGKKIAFLKRANFPMFCYVLEKAYIDNIEPKIVFDWLNKFIEDVKDKSHAFYDYATIGTTKLDSFINRYDVMLVSFNSFVRDLKDEAEQSSEESEETVNQ